MSRNALWSAIVLVSYISAPAQLTAESETNALQNIADNKKWNPLFATDSIFENLPTRPKWSQVQFDGIASTILENQRKAEVRKKCFAIEETDTGKPFPRLVKEKKVLAVDEKVFFTGSFSTQEKQEKLIFSQCKTNKEYPAEGIFTVIVLDNESKLVAFKNWEFHDMNGEISYSVNGVIDADNDGILDIFVKRASSHDELPFLYSYNFYTVENSGLKQIAEFDAVTDGDYCEEGLGGNYVKNIRIWSKAKSQRGEKKFRIEKDIVQCLGVVQILILLVSTCSDCENENFIEVAEKASKQLSSTSIQRIEWHTTQGKAIFAKYRLTHLPVAIFMTPDSSNLDFLERQLVKIDDDAWLAAMKTHRPYSLIPADTEIANEYLATNAAEVSFNATYKNFQIERSLIPTAEEIIDRCIENAKKHLNSAERWKAESEMLQAKEYSPDNARIIAIETEVKKAFETLKTATEKAEREQKKADKKRRLQEEQKLANVQTYISQCENMAMSFSAEQERENKAAVSGNPQMVAKAEKIKGKAREKFFQARDNLNEIINIYISRGYNTAADAVRKEARHCLE